MTLESSAGPTVSLGLFDWVDADGVRAAGQLYRERLDLLADAESCGFSGCPALWCQATRHCPQRAHPFPRIYRSVAVP